MDKTDLKSYICDTWTKECIPKLDEYIRIPNLSPFFDKEVLTNGHQDKAMNLIKTWVEAQTKEISGMKVDLLQEPNRTPLLLVEVPPSEDTVLEDVGTVLMYGHMDKQPPFEGWNEGLAPYEPVIKDGKLYGRGGADDGYAVFCAITALRALHKKGGKHARIVLLIEACEESGSPDLTFYLDKLKDRIGKPNFVVCLDSGCGNYQQLWVTSSLRGLVGGHLSVSVLTEGVHSGDASGVVPDTFRIARSLLSRVEDEKTGKIKLKDFFNEKAEKDKKFMAKLKQTSEVLGKIGIKGRFPWLSDVESVTDDVLQLVLNRWYRPQLTITGAEGLPPCEKAGNVLRPTTKLTLSLRLPPGVDSKKATAILKDTLLSDVPYGAHAKFESEKSADGWAAPDAASWLESALDDASNDLFGKPCVYQGEGGSIPFMAMLGKLFPQAQFMVTGVLGPQSNAHGPNEFLHIDFSAKLTCCVALVLARHCESKVETLLKATTEKPVNEEVNESPAKKAKTTNTRASARNGKK